MVTNVLIFVSFFKLYKVIVYIHLLLKLFISEQLIFFWNFKPFLLVHQLLFYIKKSNINFAKSHHVLNIFCRHDDAKYVT